MNINTNISSLVTQNYMRMNDRELSTAMERLSSGKRINSAADDAAGMAIAERMTTQVNGMAVAQRNANDGISLIQTAESAQGTISNILQRMRELAVQADNGTYSCNDVASLQSEMTNLKDEIDHIAKSTSFNGISLLNTTGSVSLHISNLATDTISVSLYDVSASSLGVGTLSLSTDAQGAITAIDSAIDALSSYRGTFGAMENRLNFTIDNLAVASNNTAGARSRIEDADMAAEVSRLSKEKVLRSSSISMLTQANQQPQQVLQLLQG